jgi:hypothetical protein
MLERINHRDVSLDLDGLAVENGWTIAPLAHCIGSGLQEERIAADHLQGLDGAVRGDDRVQYNLALAMNLLRERRIDGLDAVEQHRRLEVTDKDTWGRSRRWRRWWWRLMSVVVHWNASNAWSAWFRP